MSIEEKKEDDIDYSKGYPYPYPHYADIKESQRLIDTMANQIKDNADLGSKLIYKQK